MTKIYFSHYHVSKRRVWSFVLMAAASLFSSHGVASTTAIELHYTQCVMSQYASSGSLAQYSMVLSTGECSIDEDLGVFRTVDEGYVSTISLFAEASAEANPLLPEGTYTMGSDVSVGTWYSVEMYNVLTSYSKQDGTVSYLPWDGTLTVTHTTDGQVEIAGSLVADGTTYSISFKGEIDFYNDQTSTVITDPMDASFVEAQAVLTADESGYTLVRLEMADTYANSEGTYQSGTNLLKAVVCCPQMPSGNASEYELQDGCYSVSYSLGDFVLCPGYDDGVNLPEGSYAVMVNGSASLLGMIGDGTLTVSHSDGIYTIEANLLTAENVEIRGSYTGELPFLDIRGFSDIAPLSDNDSSITDWNDATVIDVQGRILGRWGEVKSLVDHNRTLNHGLYILKLGENTKKISF